MTKWLLKCTRCGIESYLDVAFDLTIFGSILHLYCPRCRTNTEHKVLGYIDDDTGEFVSFNEALMKKYQSISFIERS